MNIFFLIGDLIGDLIARPLSIYLISTERSKRAQTGARVDARVVLSFSRNDPRSLLLFLFDCLFARGSSEL